MKTTLNGKEYDLVIIDSNIVAQGLTEDLVFHNGYDNLVAIAEQTYGKLDRWSDYTLKDWISDSTDEESCIKYCQTMVKNAEVIIHNLN